MWSVPASPPLPGAGTGRAGSSPVPGEVREGFLCPLCLKDLLSVKQLQGHYEEAHATDDDSPRGGQIRALLGRAKRRLLKHEGSDRLDPDSQDLVYTGGVDTTKWEPQDLGAMRSVRSDFLHWRGARINHYVVEVNKLLIRLEKLTSFDRSATEPAKRKALERAVVSWVSDADVPCCPDCGSHFTLTLRRHHCRLCGSVMCKRCRCSLPLAFTRELMDAVRATVGSGGEERGSGGESLRRLSSASLASLPEEAGEGDILCCGHCRGSLQRHSDRLQERGGQPLICQLYQKLRSCIAQVDELAPEYLKVADSLNAGESTYSLDRATQMRIELMKLYERIDVISKKIAALGLNADPPPHPRSVQLQRMIRMSATHFLQEKLLGLTSIPTPERFLELKENRRRGETGQVPGSETAARTDLDTGWLASAAPPSRREPGSEPSDPLVEQIGNIRCYLKQAREAGRESEALALEENLEQLLAELRAHQRRGRGDEDGCSPPSRPQGAPANPFLPESPDPKTSPAARRNSENSPAVRRSSGKSFGEDREFRKSSLGSGGSPGREAAGGESLGANPGSRNHFGEGRGAGNAAVDPRSSGNPGGSFVDAPGSGNSPRGDRECGRTPGGDTGSGNPFEEGPSAGNAAGDPRSAGNPFEEPPVLSNPFADGRNAGNPFGEGQDRGNAAVEEGGGGNPFTEDPDFGNPFGTPAGDGQGGGNPFEEDWSSGIAAGGERRTGNVVGEARRTGNVVGEVRRTGNVVGEARITGNVMGVARGTGNVVGEARLTGNVVGEARRTGNVVGEARITGNVTGVARGTGNVVGEARRSGNAGNPFLEEGEAGGNVPERIEEELLRQQIDNIKAYAFDAKLAGRLDEAQTLLDHLSELRQALDSQRSSQHPL